MLTVDHYELIRRKRFVDRLSIRAIVRSLADRFDNEELPVEALARKEVQDQLLLALAGSEPHGNTRVRRIALSTTCGCDDKRVATVP